MKEKFPGVKMRKIEVLILEVIIINKSIRGVMDIIIIRGFVIRLL